jgi:hypothetical protein
LLLIKTKRRDYQKTKFYTKIIGGDFTIVNEEDFFDIDTLYFSTIYLYQ